MNTWTRVSVVGITALSMLGWTAGAYAVPIGAASSTQRTTGPSYEDKVAPAKVPPNRMRSMNLEKPDPTRDPKTPKGEFIQELRKRP